MRYYTTWVETTEPDLNIPYSDDSSTESGIEDGDFITSVPPPNTPGKMKVANHQPINGGFHISIEDFDDLSSSKTSFPSIHFGRSSSPGSSGTSGEDSTSSDEQDGFTVLFKSGKSKSGSINLNKSSTPHSTPAMTRTLYIQMVSHSCLTLTLASMFSFYRTLSNGRLCERFVVISDQIFGLLMVYQRIDEGISEDEAWRLFQQIVDALVHMSTLGILHRDIKLTNIFIGMLLVWT